MEILMVSSDRSSSDRSKYTLFIFKKNQFLGEKWKIIGFLFAVHKEILPKLSDFVNSDDCIGKITSITSAKSDYN